MMSKINKDLEKKHYFDVFLMEKYFCKRTYERFGNVVQPSFQSAF